MVFQLDAHKFEILASPLRITLDRYGCRDKKSIFHV